MIHDNTNNSVNFYIGSMNTLLKEVVNHTASLIF